MALIADQLRAVPGDLAVHRARPVAFGRLADDDHRAAIARIPVLHRLEHGDDLAVVVAVVDRETRSTRRKSTGRSGGSRGTCACDHAADQDIVDAGVVVGKNDTQALADLQRQGLRLELLRVALGHGEFALERR